MMDRDVAYWPTAAGRFGIVDGRYQSEADMYEPSALIYSVANDPDATSTAVTHNTALCKGAARTLRESL
jgi:hypothetical protein